MLLNSVVVRRLRKGGANQRTRSKVFRGEMVGDTSASVFEGGVTEFDGCVPPDVDALTLLTARLSASLVSVYFTDHWQK